MQSIIDNPRAALGAGLMLTTALLLGWLVTAGADGLALLGFLVRLLTAVVRDMDPPHPDLAPRRKRVIAALSCEPHRACLRRSAEAY